MDNEKTLKEILELEKLAAEILVLKNEFRQRRPIFIEFCGSPKSGKSSCINSLNIFLKRNKFRTCVLTERASICPIPDKHNPYFNVWTCCSAFTGITKNLDLGKDTFDVIIADRAIFDSLCWFQWLKTEEHLSEENFERLRDFLTMRMWRQCVDFIYVFTASPQTSMDREYATLLTRKPGSIMNDIVLLKYKTAIEKTIEKEQSTFRALEVIDTSLLPQNDVSKIVTSKTLSILKDLLVEKIGYFHCDKIVPLLRRGACEMTKAISSLQIKFHNRDIIEKDDFIQPIPVAVLTDSKRERVLVVEKKDSALGPDSPEKGKMLLWAGGHIREEDKNGNFLQTAKNALSRELKEELDVNFTADNLTPFIIYTPETGIKSKKHMAMCFLCEVDFENTKIKLDPDELKQKKGTTKSGRILNIKEFGKTRKKLDSWSKVILNKVFKVTSNLWGEDY